MKDEITVGELIEMLQQFDKNLPAKYTMGGSANYGYINYVEKKYGAEDGDFILIGERTF